MSFPGVIGKNPSKYFYPVTLQTPAARTAGANGSSVDRYRNGGYAGLTLQLLAGTWTDGTHNIVIEESADNSTWTTVASTDLLAGPGAAVTPAFAAVTSAPTAVNQSIDYIGRLRYVRCRTTASGTTTGFVSAVVALLFAPSIWPAA